MVALVVLTILLTSMGTLFYGNMAASASNRENGDAIGIANGFLAKVSAVTYASVGFYENQFASKTVPSYTGLPGVDLGASPTVGNVALISATSTPQQVGSIVYAESTYIVWVDGSGSNHQYAYKKVFSVVTWKDRGVQRSVTQSLLVYPGGWGKYQHAQNNTPSSPAGAPTSVVGLSATVPGSPQGTTEVDLTWTAPASPPGYFVVTYATDPSKLVATATSGTTSAWAPTGVSTTGILSGSATSASLTGLSSSTTYYAEVVAFSSDGSSWVSSQARVSATTLTPPPSPCAISGISVSQSNQASGTVQIGKSGSNAGHLVSGLTISVSSTGSCTASNTVTVAVVPASGSDPKSGSPYSLSLSGTSFATTVCNSGWTYASGAHTFTPSLDGVASSTKATVTFSTSNGSTSC